MNYKQLTQEERYQIYALLKTNHSQKEIAEVLERSPSSISRKLKRNKGGRGYRPKEAQHLAHERRVTAYKSKKITGIVKRWIDHLLDKDLTLEQIAGRLAIEKSITLHHESVYRYIYKDKDNGKEFSQHERVGEALEADIYFAHPYSSWEEGSNENTNGLIRRYFP